MHKRSFKGDILLLIVAIVWGFAFVFQDKAIEYVDPFTLNAVRCLISAICLIPVMIIKAKIKKEKVIYEDSKQKKDLLIASVLCGIFLCIAMNVQQFGISMYPPEAAASGRSGFITALYVIMVPLLGLFLHNKLNFNMIISVILATLGMYFLCFSRGIDKLYIGDLVVLLSALGFSLQILIVDKYSDRIDGIKLSFLEFLICSFLSGILMFIFEKPDIHKIIEGIGPILYLGVVSNGIGYTLQIVGQQYSKNPTLDCIIMSLESVFAVIGGAIILHEVLSTSEIIGCVIMFLAIIVAQLPPSLFKFKKKDEIKNS